MLRVGTIVVMIAPAIMAGQLASAQDMSRYRAYALESTVGAVVAAGGGYKTDVKTLRERPATIQELQWRAPYMASGTTAADPVREIVFTFYNDALYQIVSTYDRSRTEGLTDRDLIESISATYGVPMLASSAKTSTGSQSEGLPNTIELARWAGADARTWRVRA